MFQINRQTDYAIRMLLSLTKRGAGVRASTTEIQKEMAIPHSFAQRVVANLARGSFIQTYSGRDGGMMLARPAREINLWQLVKHFETQLFISGCKKIEDDCPLHQDCPICFQWENLKNVISQELEHVNFEDLANNAGSIKKLNFIGLVPENPLGMENK